MSVKPRNLLATVGLVISLWLLYNFFAPKETPDERGEPYLVLNSIFEAFEFDPEDRFNFDMKYAWAAILGIIVAAVVGIV